MSSSTLTPHNTKRLLDYLSSRRGDMVELLKQLVLAESPSTVPTSQKPVFALLKQALIKSQYAVRLLAWGHETLKALPDDEKSKTW
jgi:glutamate carboxypeptidase